MGIDKFVTYAAIAIAGLVCLIFVLDLAFSIFGRLSIAMDVLFILAAAFLLWQGVETVLELK